ncbi:MAG: hypothetical protein WC069_05770 [Candidatus Shapirobacteria bacterium]
MCGIIAAFNTNPKRKIESANDFVIDQYQEQFERGTRGFGIIRIDKKREIEIDRACEPTKFLMDLYTKKSNMIIAHHRTPTSTENKLNQTHPMYVSDKSLKHDYLVVHNGIVGNTKELHDKHEKLGFIYNTEYSRELDYPNYTYKQDKWNDSESIAIEIALFIENKTEEIEMDNNAAFIVLQLEKKTLKAKEVFFGRNGIGSCLNMSKSKGKLRISSEGEGEEVEVNKLFSFKVADIKMKLSKRDMEFKKKEVEKPITPTNWPQGKTFLPAISPSTSVNTLLNALNNEKVDKEPESLTEAEVETEVYEPRAWVTAETWERDGEYLIYPIQQNKGYLEEAKRDLSERMKNQTSMSMTHIIDDFMDEQIEAITDLVVEYKNQLMTRRFNQKTDFTEYTTQFFKMIKTIRECADAAENEYIETVNTETEEEIADYNGTYNSSNIGFRTSDVLSEEDMEEHMSHQPRLLD